MRDGTITTRADVYTQDIPDPSDSVIVTSESALLQTSMPVVNYDEPDNEIHGHEHGQGDRDRGGVGVGDGDGTRVDQIVNSTATFDAHPASSNQLTTYTETTKADHCTETIENDDVCDVGPLPQAVALSIAKSAFEFGSEPDDRSEPQTQSDQESSRISRIQRNGLDTDKKKPVVRRNDNSCVVDCIYFTQQCCECVIF
ncbi:uncharacterized protein LOC143365634 isoform X2 [Halictus rubicundus]|uniref:uncharacterized protein LOC143365634 isoform X2 n=1 Tax=Halictus rubicundus TaxID=77578 RepID=UPI004035FF22